MNELLQWSTGQIALLFGLVVLLGVAIVFGFRHRTHTRVIGHFVPTNQSEIKSIIVAAFFLGLLVAGARVSGITWFSEWNLDQVIHIVAAIVGFGASMSYYKQKYKVPSLIIMLFAALATLYVMSKIPSPVEVMMR